MQQISISDNSCSLTLNTSSRDLGSSELLIKVFNTVIIYIACLFLFRMEFKTIIRLNSFTHGKLANLEKNDNCLSLIGTQVYANIETAFHS